MRHSLVSYIEQHAEEEHDGVDGIQVTLMYGDEEPVVTHCPLCGAKCDTKS